MPTEETYSIVATTKSAEYTYHPDNEEDGLETFKRLKKDEKNLRIEFFKTETVETVLAAFERE